MTSVASNFTTEAMATPTTFSYAQAAKGQAATAATTPAATPPTSAQQNTTAGKDLPVSSLGDHPVSQPNTSIAETHAEDSAQLGGDQNGSMVKGDIETPLATFRTAIPISVAPSITDSRRDDEDTATEGSTRRSDKSVRSSSTAARVADDADVKKGYRKSRKGGKHAGKEVGDQAENKDKDAEKPKEEPPKVELFEAPVPSVNYWQKRQELLAASGKPSSGPAAKTSGRPDSASVIAGDSVSKSQELKKKGRAADGSQESTGTMPNGTYMNGTKLPRKGLDGDNPARRNGHRAGRLTEKDGRIASADALPSVEDVSLWPTPETVIKEDRRKASDKIERTEVEPQNDSGPAKTRPKDKWERIDFVPTVQFQTPIPSTRNSRGRGGGRGGRDGASRGGHGVAAGSNPDKSSAVGGTSSMAKQGNESRDQPREAGTPTRATSLPPVNSKRASMDASSTRDQRKPSAPTTSSDRSRELHTTAVNDQTGHGRERTESRNDRGRGGYRGNRGGHAASNLAMHSHQAQYVANGTPFSSHGTITPRHQPFSPPSRQGQFPPAFAPPIRGGRGGGRPHSTSSASSHPRMNGPNGNATRLPPVQTSMASPYDYVMQPMSAPSYASMDFFDPMLRPTLMTQVNYYLSLDNLLKDMFLRQRMDGQGFVFLDVIANFPRIKELQASMELIRSVCEESDEIDYVVGNDGLERLRSRWHWQDFTLSDEKREPSAQGSGPAYWWYRSRNPPAAIQQGYVNGMGHMGYPTASPTYYAGNGVHRGYQLPADGQPVDQSFTHPVNGNGHLPETQLSAAVPEFAPGGTGNLAIQSDGLLNSSIETPSKSGMAAHDDKKGRLSQGSTEGGVGPRAGAVSPLMNGTQDGAHQGHMPAAPLPESVQS